MRRMVAKSLASLGYRVIEAANGQEALAMWRNAARVDLLLTDMVMPEGLTGLELTDRLQAARPGLKAIVASGYSSEMVQAGAPTKPGVVYLPKPFDLRVLAAVVREILDEG